MAQPSGNMEETKNEEMIRLPTGAPIDFTIQTNLTDQAFIIGNRKIYAGKDFLSLHSPYFHDLLNQNVDETDHKEIKLRFVTYKDFYEMLKLLYSPDHQVGDRLFEPLLTLGEKYSIKTIVDHVENLLIKSTNYTNMTKFRFAERFRLIKLEATCNMDSKLDGGEMNDNQRIMQICYISADAIKRMDFITSGVFTRVFEKVFAMSSSPCNLVVSHHSVTRPGAFEMAGLLWEIRGTQKQVNGNLHLSFCLVVNDDQHSKIKWGAEGIVEIEIVKPHSREPNLKKKFKFSLDNKMRKGCTDYVFEMGTYLQSGWSTTTRVYLKKLTGVMRMPPHFDFTAPSELSDATLIVGGRRLYVNKQYMSSISSAFRAMFDKDPSGVKPFFKLEGVEYQECIEFLRWVYPSFMKNFEEDKFDKFLSMARDFDVSFVREDIEKYLRLTHPYEHLVHKICLNFSHALEIQMEDHVRYIRSILDRNNHSKPDWLYPMVKANQYYERQPEDVKVKVLEYIVDMSDGYEY